MSHEGIRFVSHEQAQREDAAAHQAESLPTDAVTPAKVRVKKSQGTGIEIDWRDGHHSDWNFRWLRDACPCATCNSERVAEGRAIGQPKPKSPDPLALYQPPPQPDQITPIGNYAINIKWNDGHQAGIYSWSYLRTHCQCADCHPTKS